IRSLEDWDVGLCVLLNSYCRFEALPRDDGTHCATLFPVRFCIKESLMNNDILRGRWNQVKGNIRSKWGKLTDDDVTQIQGDAEKMIGKLQERYGMKRDQAEKDLNEFLNQRRTA